MILLGSEGGRDESWRVCVSGLCRKIVGGKGKSCVLFWKGGKGGENMSG